MVKPCAAMVKLALFGAVAIPLLAAPTWAQGLPVSAQQRQTAERVAVAGVALGDLAANAPERVTVKTGDTLWALSGLFLKHPWRWPELWGMNKADIKNPHRIYPGQTLELVRQDGRASLRLGGDPTEPPLVKVSPRTRYEMTQETALPALRSSVIEAFLAEPIVLDEQGLSDAPRIVSALENRVMISDGDRVYARGSAGVPLLDDQQQEQQFRVFRNATPLKDPITAEILGYEAQYVGKAQLVRGESMGTVENQDRSISNAVIPATIDILSAKQEMRVGDRLVPEPKRQLQTYTPHAPAGDVEARIVSVYGNAVVYAGQNQVIAINRGIVDGFAPGLVLAIQKAGARVLDHTDGNRSEMKLPDERNGLVMVFRTFERVSYALILEITDQVKVGDRLTNPQR